LPWANIESLVDENNKTVEHTAVSTPCSLTLPAGKYQMTVFNPELNLRKQLSFSIDEKKNINLTEKLVNWDAESLMKELEIN
jgi:hypothetical protein